MVQPGMPPMAGAPGMPPAGYQGKGLVLYGELWKPALIELLEVGWILIMTINILHKTVSQKTFDH